MTPLGHLRVKNRLQFSEDSRNSAAIASCASRTPPPPRPIRRRSPDPTSARRHSDSARKAQRLVEEPHVRVPGVDLAVGPVGPTKASFSWASQADIRSPVKSSPARALPARMSADTSNGHLATTLRADAAPGRASAPLSTTPLAPGAGAHADRVAGLHHGGYRLGMSSIGIGPAFRSIQTRVARASHSDRIPLNRELSSPMSVSRSRAAQPSDPGRTAERQARRKRHRTSANRSPGTIASVVG